ncbi:MAG: Asp-tRNA(Asn)/Glu-tRNA(Gln) amidotransferase subunit GatC [Chloroflexi bacterium]|nr:Asp-tRNA(Asn)/Glu-tRNA(Gln) amidotransferase subunit GatC [Chloroflexota bacterium]
MELTHEQIRQIAELAKLDLSAEESALYAGQLTNILRYFERLQELDTSHIPPTASVLPLKNVLRPDVAQPPLPPAVALANAADTDAGQFRVSAVLGDE